MRGALGECTMTIGKTILVGSFLPLCSAMLFARLWTFLFIWGLSALLLSKSLSSRSLDLSGLQQATCYSVIAIFLEVVVVEVGLVDRIPPRLICIHFYTDPCRLLPFKAPGNRVKHLLYPNSCLRWEP